MTAGRVPDGDPDAAARALVKASQWEALLVTGLFIGLLGGFGVIIAVVARSRPISDPAMHTAMGLFWLGLGLIALVRVAAFGPRPSQSPLQVAMMGAGQAMLGAAQLTQQETVQMTLIVISCAIIVAAIAKRPRRWFAASASRSN